MTLTLARCEPASTLPDRAPALQETTKVQLNEPSGFTGVTNKSRNDLEIAASQALTPAWVTVQKAGNQELMELSLPGLEY